MDFDLLLLETEEKMLNSISQYEKNTRKIIVGRANPQVLSTIKVDYFGTLTPIDQLANISVPEARQLLIKPYDPSSIKMIIGAINNASIGLHAIDEGEKARINFPEMSMERRKELVKMLSTYTEQAKVNVRNSRQEANKIIKNTKQSEDLEKDMLKDIQKLTDTHIEKINQAANKKIAELTTI